MNNKTRIWAYMAVIVFHALTRLLFNIGMFPWIMILSTLIFFPADFHLRIIAFVRKILPGKGESKITYPQRSFTGLRYRLLLGFLAIHFFFQILLPFRYVLYPGNLFWHEEGFRFSWRVMLMEKGGTTLFYVGDPAFSGEIEINNRRYLTAQQEKMMSTQPDMILQFAHFIRDEYKGKTITIKDRTFTFTDPTVRVKSYVTLNGSGSRPFIDPQVDLAKQEYNLKHRTWVLPFE